MRGERRLPLGQVAVEVKPPPGRYAWASTSSHVRTSAAMEDPNPSRRARLAAPSQRDGRQPQELSPFTVSFAWLLLAYGAAQAETALRLEVDPVSGLVGYVSQLAGEIRSIGGALLSRDPLAGEETLLDHLRGTIALSRVLPDPAWYCFEREQVAAGAGGSLSLLAEDGTRYRFFFDIASVSSQDQRERLVGALAALLAQALGYSSQVLDGGRSLFRRMWKMDWYGDHWQPIHIRTLFGSRASVHYEHFLEECFEEACTRFPEPEGGAP